MEVRHIVGYLSGMDGETRAALAAMSDTMHAGFARMDRYFELQQKQFLEWRDELRDDVAELRARVDALSSRVGRLEQEVLLLRDHVTRGFAEVRLELRELRARAELTDELRRVLAGIEARVEQLERRRPE
jgi:putative component of toxin-antitoxin plasmid stabilization module